MRLASMLNEKYIIEDLKSSTKEDAIDELLGLLRNDKPDINTDEIKKSILEREEIENTSYGRGFSFPHARTDEVDEMYILMGISRKGLADSTPDNVPLSVIILLLTPSHISNLYLQTLSAFANFARIEGNLHKVTSTKHPSEVIEVIYNSGVSVEKELRVRDIMTRDVATVTPDDSLKHVANMMFKNKLSAMAVIDNEGNL
ncbi:MAG: PTS sugar transporter subunit IIA, partial [Candidatus Zixiibacteriota bacterium]